MFCHLDGSRSFHAPFFLVVYVSTDNSFLNNLKTICFCKANNQHVEFAHLPLFQVFLNFYQQASKVCRQQIESYGIEIYWEDHLRITKTIKALNMILVESHT